MTSAWNGPHLDGVEPIERDALLARMTRRTYHPGDPLVVEGAIGDRMFLLETGRVLVRRSTPGGGTITLAVLGPGESFGEEALLDPASRRRNGVVALERVAARVLHRDDYEDLRRRLPTVERFLVHLLAAQVRRLSDQVCDALHVGAEQRVVRRLVELVMVDGHDGHDNNDGRAASSGLRSGDGTDGAVEIPLRQEDLASMVGLARPTANRVLRQLARDGLVTIRRGRTVVLDVASLRARVH